MAYSASYNHNNRSPQMVNQQQRSPWPIHSQPRYPNQFSMPSNVPNTHNIFDPETEDSDVSQDEGEYNSTSALPVALPPALSKQALEDPDTLAAHLNDLERVEDHNVRKQKALHEKRKRKDDRIAHYRAIQDEKIKAIMNARAHRDSRIKTRRDRENTAFAQFFEESEETETRLRQRLKRLKRGLPVEEPTPGSRRVSLNSITSMSPSGPSYSTIPPPAKRHQTSHPSATDPGVPNRTYEHSSYTPAPPLSSQPSYQFYPSSRPQQPPPQSHPPVPPQPQYQPPQQLPSHHQQPQQYQPQQSQPPPQIQPQSQPAHPPNVTPYRPVPIYVPAASPPLPSHSTIGPPRTDQHTYPPNGPHGSPHLSKLPPSNSTPNPLPPRHPSASYDTRPPPPPGPSMSGFATINPPSSTGFSAINSRPAATPPVSHTVLLPDLSQEQQPTPIDRTPSRGPPSEEKSVGGGNGANKRTPSTTHPYQMSEAFANRHHHCERTDTLNRGIWTWFGPGGTQDNPVTTPTEMYLKCNHDGCGRIDWRTVHGLQCHIVKNHEQPKGTIGSLEKALERYGVPVSHIEEIERRDGLGSGGTMADPKNFRTKTKIRDSGGRPEFGRKHTPSSAQKMQPPVASDSPVPFNVPTRPSYEAAPPPQQWREYPTKEGTVHSPIDLEKQPQIARPGGGFAAINSSWQGVNTAPGNPYNARRNEHKGWPAPISAEPAQSNQGLSIMEVKHVPLPAWQAPLEATKSPIQHLPDIVERNSHHHRHQVQLPSPDMTVKDVERSENPGQTPLKMDEVRNEVVNTGNKPPREAASRSVTGDTNVDKQVEAQFGKENAPSGVSTSEDKDAPMIDVKMEETTAGTVEEKSKETTPLEQSFDADQSMQESSPMISTEVASIQSTPRRRREEKRQEERAKTSDQDNIRAISAEDESRTLLRSPEVLQKRTIPSRRESRRSSMATAASSRLSTDKMKEDDNETVSTVNTASKAESVDDDSDSITVAPRGTIDKQRDKDRGKDTPKRQANGRFSRKGR